MKRFALLATLFIPACTSEPDLAEEIASIGTQPSYIDGTAAAAPDGPSIDELVALYCPGVVYANGVTTYRGLSGTYQRIGLPAVGEPVKLKLVAERDETDANGTFTGQFAVASGLPVTAAGRFAAIPDNPAIGAAIAFDLDNNNEYDKVFFVLGLRRSFGLVRGICLAGADRPFLLTRLF